MGSRVGTAHPRQVLRHQPRGESLSSDSYPHPWPTKLCMHGWSAGSGANTALVGPLGTTDSQTLSYFNPMSPRAQNRLFHLPKEETTAEGNRLEGVLSGPDPLYQTTGKWGERGLPSFLSICFSNHSRRLQTPLWLVPPSTAEQTSCTQPFAGIVCCAAFQMLGNQQLPQSINRTGLKMKSPASTPGLLTP